MNKQYNKVPTFINFCKGKKNSEIFRALSFYSEEFAAHKVTENFKYWKLTRTEHRDFVITHLKSDNTYFYLTPDGFYLEKDNTSTKLSRPETMSDFISDCKRFAGITLEFTAKAHEVIYGFRSINRLLMSEVELNDRLRWCALFDGYTVLKENPEDEEVLSKKGHVCLQPYKNSLQYHEDYNALMGLKDKIENITEFEDGNYFGYRVDIINRGMVEILKKGEELIASAGIENELPQKLSLFVAISDFCRWFVCKEEKRKLEIK